MSGANAVAIIPARLGSTRFPEKVLAARTGKPLIQHVYEAAARAGSLSRIVIAADDPRVRDAARAFGAEAVLTDAAQPPIPTAPRALPRRPNCSAWRAIR